VTEIDDRFHQLDVLFEGVMATVDHCATYAGMDFAANVIQRFVVIEV